MACYNCRQYGHKKDACPQRSALVRCYECGASGHYSDHCPVARQRLGAERAHRLRTEQAQWVALNLPDLDRRLANKEALETFLRAIGATVHGRGTFFCRHGSPVLTVAADGRVSFQHTNFDQPAFASLLRELTTVDAFLAFVERKGLEGRLAYQKAAFGLPGAVQLLVDNGVVVCESSKKSKRYSLGGALIMYERDERGWETTVVAGSEKLICRAYDASRCDGSSLRDDMTQHEILVTFA